MAQINNLITKIFQTHGYEIRRNAEHVQYILANKDSINLAIGYNTGEDMPSRKDIRNFIKSSLNDEAHRSIYISMKSLDEDLKNILERQKVEIWDRDKVAHEIGRVMLGDLSEKVEEEEKQADFTTFFDVDNVIKPKMTEPSVESQPERQEIMVPFVLGEVQSTISGEKKTEAVDTGLSIMEPKITRELAENITKKIVRSYRFDLQLVPYYIFDYACEVVEGQSKETKTNRGTLGINTLSNHIEEWPEDFSTVSTIDQEYTKLEPAFSMEEASSLVVEAVIELNTRELETIEDKGTAIIIEKKKIRPKEDVMEISSRGTVYMPVWCVEGSNGIITVDATSGSILKEDIYKDKNVSFL
jgi:hypothetical protein